jgi:hypothetical protein
MRYSKQREEVMRVMRSGSLDHPTAQQVHDLVRSSMPDVSLVAPFIMTHIWTLITILCASDAAC